MKTYTVYRRDYLTNKKVAIGTLNERREKERNKNADDLLRLAHKLFAVSFSDTQYISVSPE